MQLDELIKELQKLRGQHGNVEVKIDNDGRECEPEPRETPEEEQRFYTAQILL